MTIADRTTRLAPLVAAAVAFILARQAMLPGLGFWDTAEFQTVGPVLGTAHPTGFPAYVILGWLASVLLQPFGEPALRMNLLSGLLVATTAALIVVLVRLLTGWTAIGVGAGIGFAAAPIAWRIATRADPHALHVTLIALLVICLVAWPAEHRATGRDRWLLVAALVFGVSLANHSLTVLLAPPVALYVLAVDARVFRRGRLLAACALLVAGSAALLYLELPLRAGPFRAPLVYGTPDTFDGFRYIVLAEQFQGSIVDPLGDLGGKFGMLVGLTDRQFGLLTPFIPIAFVATAVTAPRYALLSGVATFLTCFFAASYANADISRYYLVPLLFAWTWLAILAKVAIESVVAARPRSRVPAAAGILIADDRTRLDEHLGGIPDVIDAHLGRDPVYVVLRNDEQMPLIEARYTLADVPDTGNLLLQVTGRVGSAP